MQVLIDTNIILDWFLKRTDFFENSKKVLEKCWFGKIESFVTVHSICDLFFITQSFELEERKKLIKFILSRSQVVEDKVRDLEEFAEGNTFNDLEDMLQIKAAENYCLDYIVTRNVKDFLDSSVRALTPEEFLKIVE